MISPHTVIKATVFNRATFVFESKNILIKSEKILHITFHFKCQQGNDALEWENKIIWEQHRHLYMQTICWPCLPTYFSSSNVHHKKWRHLPTHPSTQETLSRKMIRPGQILSPTSCGFVLVSSLAPWYHMVKGGSPGLVVMGGGSCYKGREFESQYHMLDGHFFTYLFIVKFVMCVWKDENKLKRGQGGPIL